MAERTRVYHRNTQCKIEGCETPPRGSYCEKHKARLRRHGDPQAVMWPVPENPDYRYVHKLLDRERGRADTHVCASCGARARQWAYDHACANERIGTNGRRAVPYTTAFHHYQPMCLPCHRAYDREPHAQEDRCVDSDGVPVRGLGA